jgi:ribosomal protein L19E
LFMSGDPQSRLSLLGFAVSLRAARGAMVMGNVIITKDEKADQQDNGNKEGEVDADEDTNNDTAVATQLVQVEMTFEEKQRKLRETTIRNLAESERVRDEMYKFIYNNEKAPELKKSGIMCETVVASDLLSGFTQILQCKWV